ncbi:hypothetical protein HDU77_005621 [Chytriomyces hyalinus]|nr:hypothetical protein HDU77_005621 [Chytriomyces hyalinus]
MSTVAELMPKYIRALEDRITLTEQLAIERASVERLSVQVLNLQSEVQLLLRRQAMVIPAAAEKPVKREIEVIEVFDYTPPEPVVQPQRMKEQVQRPSHGVPVSLRIPPIVHVNKPANEPKPVIECCEVINLDEDEDEDQQEDEDEEEDGDEEESPKVVETEPADNTWSSHSTDAEKRKRRRQPCPESGCSKTFLSEKLLGQHFNEFHADANVVFQDGITDVIKREKETGWLFCKCSDAYLGTRTMIKHAAGCNREKRNLPFECIQTDCFRKFNEKAYLRSHQSAIHEDEVTCFTEPKKWGNSSASAAFVPLQLSFLKIMQRIVMGNCIQPHRRGPQSVPLLNFLPNQDILNSGRAALLHTGKATSALAQQRIADE